MVSPSDMMDGRVAAIRDALDAEGFTEVCARDSPQLLPCSPQFQQSCNRVCKGVVEQ